jgi:hypothetical protein
MNSDRLPADTPVQAQKVPRTWRHWLQSHAGSRQWLERRLAPVKLVDHQSAPALRLALNSDFLCSVLEHPGMLSFGAAVQASRIAWAAKNKRR